MNKTTGFIIAVIIFLASLTGVYIYLKKQQTPTSSVVKAIPINSALIFEVKEPLKFFHQLQQNNQLWNGICSLTNTVDLKANIENLDSLLFNEDLLDAFKDKSLLISMHETSKNQFNAIYLTKLSSKIEANQIIKHFEQFYSKKGEITTFRYNQKKVYKYTPTKTKKNLFFSFTRGIFMVSADELLLQDAIRQTDSETGLAEQENLTKLRATSGHHVDANLYLQYKYFKELLQQAVNRQFLKSIGIKDFGDWCAFDLNLKSQTILLNGFSASFNKSDEFSKLFDGQQPQSMKFSKFMPVETEGFTAFGISDFRKYIQNLSNYMEANGEGERYAVNQRQINQSLGKNLLLDLERIFNYEIIHITQPDGNRLFMIKTSGFSDAIELIEKSLKHYASQQHVSYNYLEQEYKVDKDTKFKVYKMPVDYLPTRIFGPWFKSAKAEYVTVYDHYLVFGNSYNSLTRFIYSNLLEKTLYYDKDFQQYENFLSSKVNFYMYTSLNGNGSMVENILNKNSLDFYMKNQEGLRNFYGLGWQFSQEGDYLYNNLLLRYQPTDKLKAATEWESRLDTLVGIKPVLVQNHNSNEKEIFVQDLKNTIYLINKSGRIIWKKELSEKIMGEVTQVDFYKNGKLQLLFNTKNYLHLLDRNGNYVDRYPVKLPSPAAATLSVFDYDNRKNYRIFVGLEDKNVIAYNIEGKTIAGFKFNGADNTIISPVQFFRADNKDYIIITDESRTYILDRKGNNRVTIKNQFDPSPNNQFILQSGNNVRKSRLVRTDTDGTIHYIYFDGSHETININPYSPKHFFEIEDVTGDHVSDYIFMDGQKLEVFDITGKLIFDYKFSAPIEKEPAFYQFSASKTYIGITDKTNRKIYLIDKNGKSIEGFPLPGKTRFSIGVLNPGSGRFSLIVGGDDQYLYNYKLN